MSHKLRPGQSATDFELPATNGDTVHLSQEWQRFRATVVLFLCNHCPYVQAYIPRLIRMQAQFLSAQGGGVRFIGICSNDAQAYPQDNFDQMKTFAQQWGLNFPYLWDEDQSVARAYGAERTPEVFVLDHSGVCCYEGGIDDNYQDPDRVTQEPLRDALTSLIHGRPVDPPQTYAIGCTIKWKKR